MEKCKEESPCSPRRLPDYHPYLLDIIENNITEIMHALGKDDIGEFKHFFPKRRELIVCLATHFNIVSDVNNSFDLEVYLKQSVRGKRLNPAVPKWYLDFYGGLSKDGKVYWVPDCFRKSLFYYPLQTGVSPMELLIAKGYNGTNINWQTLRLTSREAHILVANAICDDSNEYLLGELLSRRGSPLWMLDYQALKIISWYPNFINWVGEDISKVIEVFGDEWRGRIDEVRCFDDYIFINDISVRRLREMLTDKEAREKAHEKSKLESKFDIPYPDNEFVKVLRTGEDLKSWGLSQRNCIFSHYFNFCSLSRGFIVKIIRSRNGSTGSIRMENLEIEQIRGVCNSDVPSEDYEELKRWIAAAKRIKRLKNGNFEKKCIDTRNLTPVPA